MVKRKRVFNKRQMAILELVCKKKSLGEKIITLDEVMKVCHEGGHFARVKAGCERQTALSTMNILIERLKDSGVTISKPYNMGRGKKTEFKI
jgi:hypothetical protein